MERYPAIIWEYHTHSWLLCHNVAPQYPQTPWRPKCTGPPPRGRVPLQPGMSPAPHDDNEYSETDGVTPIYLSKTCSTSHCSIDQFWSICQAFHAQSRCDSRFADSQFSIDRVVHCTLRCNAAERHFDDSCGRLTESDSYDTSSLKGTWYLSIIIIYN
jgi:hypothetical protein